MKNLLLIPLLTLIACQTKQKSEVVETPTARPPTLSWDTKEERKEWTTTLLSAVNANWDRLSKATDLSSLCPKYPSFSENKKKIVFGELFVAMSYQESGWRPTNRMQETTMGIDPITKLPVFSEGLFQLSYQDEPWAKCGFDWAKDMSLSPTSPEKTILNPHLNIDCGVRIMARQISKKEKVLLTQGVYWSVIKIGGKHSKIPQITERIAKAIPECTWA